MHLSTSSIADIKLLHTVRNTHQNYKMDYELSPEILKFSTSNEVTNKNRWNVELQRPLSNE